MIEIVEKISVGIGVTVFGTIALPFELRQKSRLRTTLATGEAVLVKLPRGEVLRGGDLLRAADGRVVEVVAQPERLIHCQSNNATELARWAYHLGNRHLPVQLGDGYLRIAKEPVIDVMLRGLGAAPVDVIAAFEPESGAYRGVHAHAESAGQSGPRIHDYAATEQSNK